MKLAFMFSTRRIALACFMAGVGAMIDQVAWFRLLATMVGSDIWASSMVLCVFLLGLGLGSLTVNGEWFTRLQWKGQYSFIIAQLILACNSIASPILFGELRAGYAAILWFLPAWMHGLVGLFATILFLGIPCLAMGLTVPLLLQALAQGTPNAAGGQWKESAGRLYTLNNLGAVIGTLASGFLLLEILGVWGCVLASTLVHLCAGLMLFTTDSSIPADDLMGSGRRVTPAKGNVESPIGLRRCTLFLFGAMNFALLGLEIVWIRALSSRFLEVTVYSLSCVGASVIAGMALGAMLGRPWAQSDQRRLRWIPWCAAGIPIWSALSWIALPRVYDALQRWLPSASMAVGRSWGQSIALETALSAIPLFVPGLLVGMIFPVLASLLKPSGEDRASAQLLAIGSVTGAAGAAIAGLWLVPAFGLKASVVGMGVPVLLALAAWSWLTRDVVPAKISAVLPPLSCLATLLSSWIFLGAWRPTLPPDSLIHHVLFREESAGAVVEVWKDFIAEDSSWFLTLAVDGHRVAGTHPIIEADQKLLAHIPLLLHPRPRKALTVGLGSGGTSYSMRLHGVDVACYEILPAVTRAAKFFPANHRGVFSDPGFRLETGDARHLLLKTQDRFDVIVSDVTDIHFLGNASLLTRDYFQLAKSRLAKDGIFAVWLPRDPGRQVLRHVFSTFLSVFPKAQLWYPYQVDSHFSILVGLPEGWRPINWADWKRRTSSQPIQRDLSLIGSADPLRLALNASLDTQELTDFASGASVHSDLRPILDFLAARSAYVPSADLLEMLSRTDSKITSVFDTATLSPRDIAMYSQSRHEAIKGYLALFQGDGTQALMASDAAERVNPKDIEFERSALAPLRLRAHLDLAEQLAQAGDLKGAALHLGEVLWLRPNHVLALNNLGVLAAKSGDSRRARAFFAAAANALPEAAWIKKNLDWAKSRPGSMK